MIKMHFTYRATDYGDSALMFSSYAEMFTPPFLPDALNNTQDLRNTSITPYFSLSRLS